ncbi:MarR family winged helix-turn-helix transcriptional regulator [Paenibacillus sanguinis]|uniref:MarR family winged helix-turn-helix transcriptional regulator n=1 Tax=Paenibacillus sanguinis TaxID=225906 RepID=UPI0003783420|nr:MarR family transcriptional regulator [Paenibacillus sanguinis]
MTSDKPQSFNVFDQLQQFTKKLSPKFEQCAGISSSRLMMLVALFQAEELSQASLQKTLDIDAAAITRHLKQLEASGMVTRRSNPADNRIILVALTSQGREQIEAYCQEKTQFMEQLFHSLEPGDLRNMSELLARLTHNLDSMQPK